MRVLVTGASGFLGSHVVERLAATGDTVRAMVRTTSSRKHLQAVPNVELFEASVEQVDRVREAVDGMDAVVHVAGLVKARSPEEFLAVNVGGTSNLIQAVRPLAQGGRFKRFVFVSSLEACGPTADGSPVPLDQENPVTSYGRSKLSAEKVVLSAKDEVSVVILRPGAIYGPRDVEILEAFRAIKRGVLPLVGGGAAKGPWIYVTDCAEACVRAVHADIPSGSIYFVDNGSLAITQRQMLLDAEAALGRRAFVRADLPVPVFMTIARGLEVFGRVTNRPVMLTREKANMLLQNWACSSEAARRDLGWEPKVDWKEGLARTVQWARESGTL